MAFEELHSAMQKRIAANWCESCGTEVSFKKICDILDLIRQGGTLELRKGKYLEVSGDRITLKSAPLLQGFFSVQLKWEKTICLKVKN